MLRHLQVPKLGYLHLQVSNYSPSVYSLVQALASASTRLYILSSVYSFNSVMKLQALLFYLCLAAMLPCCLATILPCYNATKLQRYHVPILPSYHATMLTCYHTKENLTHFVFFVLLIFVCEPLSFKTLFIHIVGYFEQKKPTYIYNHIKYWSRTFYFTLCSTK